VRGRPSSGAVDPWSVKCSRRGRRPDEPASLWRRRKQLAPDASYSMDVAKGRVDKQNVDPCSQQPGSGECGSRRSDFTELKVPDMNGCLRRLANSESRMLEHE